MPRGTVVSICISPAAREPMQYVSEVNARRGVGLEGDRYAEGRGSYNKGAQGKRQVTLINNLFIAGSGFTHDESRRNIAVKGVELMWLIGRHFTIGEAVFYGEKYCEPCHIPSKLANMDLHFAEVFHDRGGLVARVIKSGLIRVGDSIIPPPKKY